MRSEKTLASRSVRGHEDRMNYHVVLRLLTSVLLGMVVCEVTMVFWERYNGPANVAAPHSISAKYGADAPQHKVPFASSPTASHATWWKNLTNFRDDDLDYATLMSAPDQLMSCFPSVTNASAWNRHPCGVLVDGYSMRARMPLASYRHLASTLTHDLLYASSAHLPYFHEFARVVVVHQDAIGDPRLLKDGVVLHSESGAVVQLMDTPTQGVWARPAIASLGLHSRILLVITNKTTGLDPPLAIPASPFDVMLWTPFDRTLFVNASVGIPGRRKVAPPTLLLSLLDHFDVLLSPMPFMEEALLKLQRAGCWPLRRDALISQHGGGIPLDQFYVGLMHHSGIAWYRRNARVEQLWRASAAIAQDPSPSLSPHSQCDASVVSHDPLLHDAFALSTALRVLRTAFPAMSPSISVVDPIHFTDTRYGPDPCSRIVNRPSRFQKKDKFQLFRGDVFRT